MAEDQVKGAIEWTVAEARRAVDAHGVSDSAMQLIREALRRLAETPGLEDHAGRLRELHGSDAAATVLASEGPEGLTLVLGRFLPDAPTPVHDHGSWGIIYVLKGHDRYVHWQRLDDGTNPERAQLIVEHEKVLGPGDSTHWFDPPKDIHSQQGHGDTVLELVLFGRDTMRAPRHYFDVETGRVAVRRPQ